MRAWWRRKDDRSPANEHYSTIVSHYGYFAPTLAEGDAAVIMEQVLAVGDEHVGIHFPAKVVKCMAPLAVAAEIMMIECRVPVVATIGVCPTGTHVVPEW